MCNPGTACLAARIQGLGCTCDRCDAQQDPPSCATAWRSMSSKCTCACVDRHPTFTCMRSEHRAGFLLHSNMLKKINCKATKTNWLLTKMLT